jgi:phosphoglycerate dehydrogenase-like enzyme
LLRRQTTVMSDSPLVLVLANGSDPQLAMLSGLPHMIATDLEQAAHAAPQAQVILHWSGSRELLRAAFLANPQVRWVHSKLAGLDSALFPELIESSVPVTNGKGVFSQSLGEFALAMILYFAKDFPRMLRNKAEHRWQVFEVDEISNQTVGIVGYGDIGRAVASRACAMGMKVFALKRHAPALPDPQIAAFYKPAELHAMLAQCDYVAVCAPLTPETHHMISDNEFAAMKTGAVVINVGRGPVIDQAALLRSLNDKKIRGAGLDVFEQEPIPESDPIWDLENVFISPHTADRTRTWLDEAMQFFLKQYERFSTGKPLENVVDKHLGY